MDVAQVAACVVQARSRSTTSRAVYDGRSLVDYGGRPLAGLQRYGMIADADCPLFTDDPKLLALRPRSGRAADAKVTA
ncbi:MAG: hypothetical protein BGO98_31005 [Myxococcales bacterium 68-20]|nr:hypothetical protein [Myxococcales bacterium]OJY22146.1 MAG: hypothetical protein BGO98_31005 [Myxococcales bacterium 68-20]